MNKKYMDHKNLEIKIAKDYEELSLLTAGIILNQILEKPASILGLATGSTPKGTYKRLINLYEKDSISFEKVKTFNLDEYFPIKKDDKQSYNYYMRENLFNHIDINIQNTFIQNGEATDPIKECEEYEALIEKTGKIDLQILGLGLNGHIGFNEPDSIFSKFTHCVELDSMTIDANTRFFENKDQVPKHALTMGIATIMSAKHIVLLISGASKAEIAKQVLFGEINPNVPGSILQLHNNVTVILDEDAAKKIEI